MPMTPGLAPNIRQLFPEEPPAISIEMVEDGDTPVMDQKGNILEIEHGDGSISISLDGKPLDEAEASGPKDWFDNLVDDIDQMELSRISDELLKGVSDDIDSRKEWIENRATGIKLMGLKIEVPGLQGASDGAPVEGMSKVRHPLLLEAVLRFQANARSELLPTDGPVKIRNDDNNATVEEDRIANALETDLNHFLTTTATEYYPDTDRMLLMLGFGGTAFKKVYFCPLRNRPVSETVDADDLIVNNAATDLRNAKRITHRSYMRPSIVRRLQILGVYKDIDLSQAKAPKLDSVQREKNSQQGISASDGNPEDRDREIYEIYCELDIAGFEHKYKGKVSGLEIPYRVTIDVSSKQILSIVRNYDEDEGDLPEARVNFVKYSFVPGLGFYDIGLLQILGNTTNAITAAWRELLDAGMYSNFPGFLMADTGARQNTNIFRVPPGGGALVKTGGLPINQAIMPLPYQAPSGALMSLVDNMAQTGMRIGGTSEQQVGEGRADAPVGTTLAMIDQATKVMNAVHKRMHAAQAEEFRLLVRTFKDNPDSFWQRNKQPAYQWDQETFLKAIEDYELTPQADPNTASHSQRMMKVAGLMQLMGGAPELFDKKVVMSDALQAMGWSNPEQFYTKPQPPNIEQMIMSNPMILKEVADLLIKKQDSDVRKQEADTRKLVADAQAAELHAKALAIPQESQQGGGGLNPMDQAKLQADLQLKNADLQLKQAQIAEVQAKAQMTQTADPMKMADLQLRQQELAQKQEDSELDAINRKRDRESRERLAAIKLAEDAAQNPQGLGIINQIIDPQMIDRLEANEPKLNSGSD
jgi:hypothetical protein